MTDVPKQTGLVGRIAWPREGDLWVASLPGPRVEKIATFPRENAVTSVAWSPDGSRLVFALSSQRPGETVTGADLMVADADGSNARVFVARDQAGTVLDMPQWLPSGRVYYTQLHVAARDQHPAVMRAAERMPPEVVLDGGYAAAVSDDELTLVYLQNTAEGQSLRKTTVGASGRLSCELLGPTRFFALGPPRLSPDGASIALAASGEPAGPPRPSGCGGAPGVPNAAASEPAPQTVDLAQMLGLAPATALAHGLPFAVWRMGLDGGNLRRVVDLQDDDPRVAWSPDGARLAIFSPGALYVADAAGGEIQKVVNDGGYGGLDWAR